MSVAARNVSPVKRLAMNFCLLSAGELLAKLLTFAAFAHLAHTLGAERYGTLEFVLAVMVFFTLPADLGLGAYGAREIARNVRNPAKLFHEITQMRVFLSISSFVLLFVFIAFLRKPSEVKLLLAMYGFSLLLGPALLQWVFQAYDMMHWVALASIIRQTVFTGLLFVYFRPGTPMVAIGAIEVASVFVVAVYCLCLVRYRLGMPLPRPSFNKRRLLEHFRQGLPIGLTELAWAFMWYFATVILGLIFSDESLGWFGASHRMLMALHTFIWLYFFNLLPSISRCATEPSQRLLNLLGPSLRLVAWAGVFAAFVMTMFAREALVIAYGPSFAGGTHCLEVLMWILPVAMLSGHYRYTLIAYNLQTRLLYCTAASAAVAILAGLALVPLFGATGAAVALLVANVSTFALVYMAVRRQVVAVPFAGYLARPAIALAVGAAVFLSLFRFNVWTAGTAGAAAYLAVMAILQRRHFLSLARMVLAKEAVQKESLAG